MPDRCPVCETPTIREEDEVARRCPNAACPAQLREHLRHFARRNAMDIQGLGDALIEQLVQRRMVADVADIYGLSAEGLAELERMGAKSAENVIEQIESSKTRPLERLLFALGIRHVGERAAVILAENLTSMTALLAASDEQLEALDEIGPKTVRSLGQFFGAPGHRELVDRLERAGVRMTTDRRPAATEGGHPLAGKTVVFTGTLPGLGRSEAKAAVERVGGRVAGSVSKKTDFLVAADKAGSKLDKARALGVTILDPEAFRALIDA